MNSPQTQRFFIRSLRAGDHMELFLVTAVASILVIRFFLHITGYPQIGGGGLHIAHMLWGGLMMLAALVMNISFLSPESRGIATFIGGAGFGTFIDEIGKFVTSDNNYFFEPSVGLMYLTFVGLFLAGRWVQQRSRYSREEYLYNAVMEVAEAARNDLEEKERARALANLKLSDPGHPLVPALIHLLGQIDAVPDRKPPRLRLIQERLKNWYFRLVSHPFFARGVVLFFVAELLVRLVYVIGLVFFPGFELGKSVLQLDSVSDRAASLGFSDLVELVSIGAATVCVVLGAHQLRRSRLAAYRWFKTSLLIGIFVTQVFTFFKEEFHALIGLSVQLLLLLAIDYMMFQEEAQAQKDAVA